MNAVVHSLLVGAGLLVLMLGLLATLTLNKPAE
jgi:hypothetical protein